MQKARRRKRRSPGLAQRSARTTGVAPPAATATGPSTFAERRELLVLATKALTSLPQRDVDLVRWRSEGLGIDEQSERLGLSYAATQRAGLRALERFQAAFELVLRASVRDARGPVVDRADPAAGSQG